MSKDIQEIGLYIIMGTSVILLLFIFIMIMLFMHRNKQLKNRQNILKLTAEYEKAMYEAKMEIHEETLRYAGREIHDNIGQILSLVKLNLSSPSESQIANAKELLAKAIQDIRSLAKSLNMDWAEHTTIGELIEQECFKIEKSGLMEVKYYQNSVCKLPLQEKIILFRGFQECISNIIKHAEASLIEIYLQEENNYLKLAVADNGKGFNINKVTKGSGLDNIQKRASLLNGSINLFSKEQNGTTIEMVIPISDKTIMS